MREGRRSLYKLQNFVHFLAESYYLKWSENECDYASLVKGVITKVRLDSKFLEASIWQAHTKNKFCYMAKAVLWEGLLNMEG